jgi:hypothetical protein
MEKNTVLLSLEDYNSLRDFETNIKKNNTIILERWKGVEFKKVISTDSIVKVMVEEANKFHKEFTELEIELKVTKQELEKAQKLIPKTKDKKEITIEDIKNMSYWEFRKWKKNK